MKAKLNGTSGITLIALVIMVIVLLILAGISIVMLTGDNGILTNAQIAKGKTEVEGVKEQIKLQITELVLERKCSITESLVEEALQKCKENGIINYDGTTITTKTSGFEIAKEEFWSDNITIDTKVFGRYIIATVSGVESSRTLSDEECQEMQNERLRQMSDAEKEELFVELNNLQYEIYGYGTQVADFEDYIDLCLEDEGVTVGEGQSKRDAFYSCYGGYEDAMAVLEESIIVYAEECDYSWIEGYHPGGHELRFYELLNPAGEEKDYYMASEDGEYLMRRISMQSQCKA